MEDGVREKLTVNLSIPRPKLSPEQQALWTVVWSLLSTIRGGVSALINMVEAHEAASRALMGRLVTKGILNEDDLQFIGSMIEESAAAGRAVNAAVGEKPDAVQELHHDLSEVQRVLAAIREARGLK